MALKRLMKERMQYEKEPSSYYSININENNIYEWKVLLFVSDPDSPFYQGTFECMFKFPQNYPNKPPEFRFLSKFPHPNIYSDGKVCISILHEGKDEYGYEHISERWNPSHSVDSVLMSVSYMLSNPNFESPANVDASVLWKNNEKEYKKIIYKLIADQHNL
jgi:ubiquitin-protein ligase